MVRTELPPAVTGLVPNAAVAPDGTPLTLSETDSAAPLPPVALTRDRFGGAAHARRADRAVSGAALRQRHTAWRRTDREIVARRGAARRELERCDPGLPVERSVRRDVLARKPERAVVRRVDRHRRVIAPARERPSLRAGAGDDGAFPLRHRAGGIAGQPARVPDRWFRRARRRGESQAHVARLVHRDAAHPAERGVGR